MTSVTQAARAAAQLRQAARDVARVAASRGLPETEKADGNPAGVLTHSDGHTVEQADGSAQSDCPPNAVLAIRQTIGGAMIRPPATIDEAGLQSQAPPATPDPLLVLQHEFPRYRISQSPSATGSGM